MEESFMENVKPKNMKYIVNSMVGIMIMFAFWIIPPIAPVTSYGMQLLGVLAVCIHLWYNHFVTIF